MGNEPVFVVEGSPSRLPGKGWVAVGVYNEAEYHDDETDQELYQLYVRVARRDDGQLICTGLLFGGDWGENEVTARALRDIPMSVLLRSLARDDRLLSQFGKDWPPNPTAGSRWPLNPTRAGSKGLPDEHFEAVANGYREAVIEAPRAPIKYLVERWHHPAPTIRTWVRQARERGLLGEATHGKAGEKPRPLRRGRQKR